MDLVVVEGSQGVSRHGVRSWCGVVGGTWQRFPEIASENEDVRITFLSVKTPMRFIFEVDTRLRRVSTRETARISQGRAGWKMLGSEHGHHGRSRA